MIRMIGDNELDSLLNLPAEERLKLARILIESAAKDALGDSSNQQKIESTNSWLLLAGRYAGGPGDTSERAETILETEVDKLSGLSVR